MKCDYCTDNAFIRCRKHRMHLCGGANCVALHRWGYAGVPKHKGGDCEFVEARRFDPMQLLLTACGISVAVVATAMAWAHLARVR